MTECEDVVADAVSRPVRGDRHGGSMTTTTTTTTTSNTTTCTTRASCFSSRLDAEWQHLRVSRRSLQTARRWSADEPEHPLRRLAADVHDLDTVLAATHRGGAPAGTGDEILLRLIDLARDDQLAGRLVVQRLLPALISRSRRYVPFQRSVDPIEIVVAAAWLAVSAYDTGRRRHDVASSLVSDAVFTAFRQPFRRRSATESVRPIRHFAMTPSTDVETTAFEELADVVRVARHAGVSTQDLDLVRHLVRVGSPGVVAQQRGVTPRTIRNHRDRAIAHIREALDAA